MAKSKYLNRKMQVVFFFLQVINTIEFVFTADTVTLTLKARVENLRFLTQLCSKAKAAWRICANLSFKL